MDLTYLRCWTEHHLTRLTRHLTHGDSRRNDAGMTTETIVIMGVSLLGAAVISTILWAKLKGGANAVIVPPATAP